MTIVWHPNLPDFITISIDFFFGWILLIYSVFVFPNLFSVNLILESLLLHHLDHWLLLLIINLISYVLFEQWLEHWRGMTSCLTLCLMKLLNIWEVFPSLLIYFSFLVFSKISMGCLSLLFEAEAAFIAAIHRKWSLHFSDASVFCRWMCTDIVMTVNKLSKIWVIDRASVSESYEINM